MRLRSQISIWFGVILLVPMLYFAGCMPIIWAYNHKYLDPSGPTGRVVDNYFMPARYAYHYGPPWFRGGLERYAQFMSKL